MTGRPLVQRMVDELEKRAALITAQERAPEPLGPLDVVYDYISAGGTLTDLQRELGTAIGYSRMPSIGMLTTWVNGTPEGKAMLVQARQVAAHTLAEEALRIVDEVDEDRGAVAKAKLQADQRRWTASKWNRPVYGETPAVAVAISSGSQHLEALRVRTFEVIAQTQAAALGDGTPDVEVVQDDS